MNRLGGTDAKDAAARRCACAGALGLFASGYSGVLNEGYGQTRDLVVWITEETGRRR